MGYYTRTKTKLFSIYDEGFTVESTREFLDLQSIINPNVNFDMGRYGIEFLASPRHCDGVVVTGPIVENSVDALRITMEAIPQPKILILAGACAVSGGVFAESKAINRKFLEIYKPDLLVPGCPPHPLTFINGVLELIK